MSLPVILAKDPDGTVYRYQDLAIRVGRRNGSKNTRWNCCTKGTPSSRPMPTWGMFGIRVESSHKAQNTLKTRCCSSTIVC